MAPAIIVVIVFNMIVYFKRKADISSYFVVFSYLGLNEPGGA